MPSRRTVDAARAGLLGHDRVDGRDARALLLRIAEIGAARRARVVGRRDDHDPLAVEAAEQRAEDLRTLARYVALARPERRRSRRSAASRSPARRCGQRRQLVRSIKSAAAKCDSRWPRLDRADRPECLTVRRPMSCSDSAGMRDEDGRRSARRLRADGARAPTRPCDDCARRMLPPVQADVRTTASLGTSCVRART